MVASGPSGQTATYRDGATGQVFVRQPPVNIIIYLLHGHGHLLHRPGHALHHPGHNGPGFHGSHGYDGHGLKGSNEDQMSKI